MPGDKCAIFDCSVSRSRKYKGISLYKIPSGIRNLKRKPEINGSTSLQKIELLMLVYVIGLKNERFLFVRNILNQTKS